MHYMLVNIVGSYIVVQRLCKLDKTNTMMCSNFFCYEQSYFGCNIKHTCLVNQLVHPKTTKNCIFFHTNFFSNANDVETLVYNFSLIYIQDKQSYIVEVSIKIRIRHTSSVI
jgi:hypothetical protein